MRTSPLYLFILTIAFLITFNSCKKENNQTDNCLLASIRDDAGGVYMTYEYDNDGRLIKQTDVEGDSYNLYDYSGSSVQMETYYGGVHTGHSTTVKDGQGRIIMRIDEPANDPTGTNRDTVFYTYDANGHLIRTEFCSNEFSDYCYSFTFTYVGDDAQTVAYQFDIDTFTIDYTYTTIENRGAFFPMTDMGFLASPPALISLSKHLPATMQGNQLQYEFDANDYVKRIVMVDAMDVQDTIMNVTLDYTCK